MPQLEDRACFQVLDLLAPRLWPSWGGTRTRGWYRSLFLNNNLLLRRGEINQLRFGLREMNGFLGEIIIQRILDVLGCTQRVEGCWPKPRTRFSNAITLDVINLNSRQRRWTRIPSIYRKSLFSILWLFSCWKLLLGIRLCRRGGWLWPRVVLALLSQGMCLSGTRNHKRLLNFELLHLNFFFNKLSLEIIKLFLEVQILVFERLAQRMSQRGLALINNVPFCLIEDLKDEVMCILIGLSCREEKVTYSCQLVNHTNQSPKILLQELTTLLNSINDWKFLQLLEPNMHIPFWPSLMLCRSAILRHTPYQ